jgi:hypothetical protein
MVFLGGGGGVGMNIVINDYFRSGIALNRNFNAFYALQVFEHVDKPTIILKDAYNFLEPGGVGLLEVPNGLTIINKSQYHSIFSDHLHYYTPLSLSMLAHLSGFQVLCVRPSLNDYHLEIFIRKPESIMSIMEKRQRQCDKILNEASKYLNIVLWGAGAKAYSLLGCMGDSIKITNIVDMDPCKDGLYIPGASMCVKTPSPDLFLETDLVVILSSPYVNEITKTLCDNFHYKGKIISVDDD